MYKCTVCLMYAVSTRHPTLRLATLCLTESKQCKQLSQSASDHNTQQ